MTTPRKPFFHQAATHRAIGDVASCKDLIVYVGAGYSIDRSGLAWKQMISSLLEFNGSPVALNDYLIENHDLLPAASIAENEYRAVADPANPDVDTHRKISDRLRSVLYSPLAWQRGELGKALADFAYTWIDYGVKAPSRRIAFITTNYDDYLHMDLTEGWNRAQKVAKSRHGDEGTIEAPVVVFPTSSDPLIEHEIELSGWAKAEDVDQTLLDSAEIRCAYLHGRIPVAASAEERFPVVSENDYALTRQMSESALAAAFAESDVVLVGSSLTDPPLLNALRETRGAGRRRWALMLAPDPASLPDGVNYAEVIRRLTRRVADLGVKPLFFDYPVQVAQFFHELGLAANLASPKQYAAGDSRYGRRLTDWWNEWWAATVAHDFTKRQRESHEFLARLMPHLKDQLDSSEEEQLKLEVWLRAEPDRRQLMLWSTSTGTWLDRGTMRCEKIAGSDLIAAQAFRSGRPQAKHSEDSRWRNLIAAPIWARGKGYEASLILGAVVMASTADDPESSLIPSRNAAKILQSLELLNGAGLAIANADVAEVEEFLKTMGAADPM